MAVRTAAGPTLVYDGDCGFCTRCVRFVERRLSPPRATRLQVIAWQEADLDVLGVQREDAEKAVQWVAASGRVSAGAEAVARLLRNAGGPWSVAGSLLLVPPVRWGAERVYRLIAANRGRLPGATPACALPADQRPGASARRGGHPPARSASHGEAGPGDPLKRQERRHSDQVRQEDDPDHEERHHVEGDQDPQGGPAQPS